MVVPVEIAGRDAVMLVLRPRGAPAAPGVRPPARVVVRVTGPWHVAFDPGRGAPAGMAMTTLVPLDRSSEPGIRYFSGVARYTTIFHLPAGAGPHAIDLGNVGDVAQVLVNGVQIGTAWHAPFRLPLGRAAHSGLNTLKVRVADLWHNRLIGDAQPGAVKVAFVAAPTYRPNAPLRPAGLIRPVTIDAP